MVDTAKYVLSTLIHRIVIYPLDSVICHSDKWIQRQLFDGQLELTQGKISIPVYSYVQKLFFQIILGIPFKRIKSLHCRKKELNWNFFWHFLIWNQISHNPWINPGVLKGISQLVEKSDEMLGGGGGEQERYASSVTNFFVK